MKTLKIQVLNSLISLAGLLLLFGLSACDSGGSAANNSYPATPSNAVVAQLTIPSSAQTMTPASLQLTTSQTTSSNSCFVLLATPNGKGYTSSQNSQAYYSTADVSFSIKNNCSSAASMSGLLINVNNLTLNGKAAAINNITQSQSNPYLSLSYTSSGSNSVLNLSTPACSGEYCSWALVPAGSSISLTINSYVNAAIGSFALDSVTLAGSTPPPSTGSLAVNINTSALLPICPAAANCGIEIRLLNSGGAAIQTIKVNPFESPNYTLVATNLLIGNYSLAVNTNSYPSGSAGSISYSMLPAGGVMKVNGGMTSNTSVSFSYAAAIPVGSLTLKNILNSEATLFSNIGPLSGKLSSTKTKQVYPFSMALNGSYTLNNLPANDTYLLTLQGIANPATGSYYAVTPLVASVVANTPTSVNLAYSKVSSSQNSVTFVVSGSPAGQTVAFADNNGAYKYNANPLASGVYKFLLDESAVAVNLATPSGYGLEYTPKVITPAVKTLTATYTASIPATANGLTTFNDKIIDSKNNEVVFKGINWFGFNNSDMLNGMWNYDGLSGDFASTVLRLKALGFNAVRLPFTFAILNGAIQSTYNRPGLSPATAPQLISNLTNPSYDISGKTFPTLAYSDGQTFVNQYLPNSTVMARFLYVIDYFAKNGFYVLIDNHSEDNSITTNQDAWIANWKSLAANIVNLLPSASSMRVMYDLRNEPDAIGWNWTKMGPLYLATLDALNSVTKGNNLFFIEGSGQAGADANWGDGFSTNSTLIQQKGLSDPNQFFQSLATKPYLKQIVLSPHVYPPSVTNAATNFSGSGLYNRLSNSFGVLAKTGYCVAGVCHRYPIAIGEFGSKFEQANDLAFFISFANYLNNSNDALDNLHNQIQSWFYWSYNPNSGDTGGIIQDDWKTIQWSKVNYLSNGIVGTNTGNPGGLGLNPWYK